jgi:peptidyl-tRNA hydrolase
MENDMEQTRELTVYVLARTDLPSMNPGKMSAQVHHAGVQMMAKYHKNKMVQDYVKDGLAQGADHFNTTIVLAATLDDIWRVSGATRRAMAKELGDRAVVFDTVTDPSYPFLVESMEIANLIPQDDKTKIVKVLDNGRVVMVRPEYTVAWFLGDRNDERFRNLFEGLALHP